MGARWSSLWILAALVAACGSGGGMADDDDGDDDGTVIDAPDQDGAVDAGVDAVDAPPPLPICTWGCDQLSDCPSGTAGTITDLDNYECRDGHCEWTGCNGDAECRTTFNDQRYVCAAAFGFVIPTCWETCVTEADCPHRPVSPGADADNYVCDDGKCRWTGCNSSAECPATASLCAVRGTSPIPSCWTPCDTPADCGSASPPFDADNYVCDDGACVYRGCHTTEECMALGSEYVCTQ